MDKVQTPNFVCSRRKVVYGQVRVTIFRIFRILAEKSPKEIRSRSQKNGGKCAVNKNPVHLLNSMTTTRSLKISCPSCMYACFEPNKSDIPWIPTIWETDYRNGGTLWHITATHELAGRRLANWIRLIPPILWIVISRGPFADKDESARVTYILLWVGQEGLRMYNTWDLSDSDSKKVDVILGRFKSLIEPNANFRLSRFNMQKFRQTTSESVDEFMTRCRIQGKKCRFRDALEAEERLIEQLIIGIRHTRSQEKLLSRDDMLTLDAAMDIARTHESTLADMNAFQSETSLTTHLVKQRREDGKQREGRRGNCTNCNRQHPTGKCPAANSRFRACGRHGYWEAACRSKSTIDAPKPSSQKPRRPRSQSQPGRRGNKQTVNQLRVNEDGTDDDTFQHLEFNSVTENDGRDEIFATLEIALRNGTRERDATLKVKVDTGAQGNILPVRTFKRMYPELLDESGVPSKRHLRHRPTILTAYNGAAMAHHGTIVIQCSYGKRQCDTEFYVVETPGPVIAYRDVGRPRSANTTRLESRNIELCCYKGCNNQLHWRLEAGIHRPIPGNWELWGTLSYHNRPWCDASCPRPTAMPDRSERWD